MTRLWSLGGGLDPLVLDYTAGEDHALDDRLVPHDVRASIAHGAMLAGRGLLSAADFAAIRAGLEALGAEHAAGAWRVELEIGAVRRLNGVPGSIVSHVAVSRFAFPTQRVPPRSTHTRPEVPSGEYARSSPTASSGYPSPSRSPTKASVFPNVPPSVVSVCRRG